MQRRSSFELNNKEKKVLAAFPRKPGTFITIEDLARRCFASVGVAPDKKGNSWVRNSLRKLLRLKLVKHKGAKAGEYARTELRPSDVINTAIDKGLCPGPKVGTKQQSDDDEEEDEDKKGEAGESE